jgi:hypothetical protein
MRCPSDLANPIWPLRFGPVGSAPLPLLPDAVRVPGDIVHPTKGGALRGLTGLKQLQGDRAP